jgi:hypothetical protein
MALLNGPSQELQEACKQEGADVHAVRMGIHTFAHVCLIMSIYCLCTWVFASTLPLFHPLQHISHVHAMNQEMFKY